MSVTIIECKETQDRPKTFDKSYKIKFLNHYVESTVRIRRRIGETEFKVYPQGLYKKEYELILIQSTLDHINTTRGLP